MKNYNIDKIKTIKQNKSFCTLVEVGAGMPVYNKLCSFSNTASILVNNATSPNNWNFNKLVYNHTNDQRAVSYHVCNNFIDHHKYDESNTILVNTIQISNNKDVCAHGWFGLYSNDKTFFYHFNLNKHYSRTQQIELISSIGLDILASDNDYTKLDSGYIDDCIELSNDTFIQRKDIILTCLLNNKLAYKNNHNSAIYIKNNEYSRINNLLRESNDILMFKGSFNPVHKGHLEMMEHALKQSPNSKPIFSISISNREKNKTTSVSNLLKRIELIQNNGYDVVIDTLGYFNNSIDLITNSSDYSSSHVLKYVLGSDTTERLLIDEKVIENDVNNVGLFISKYNKCTFYYYNRNNYKLNINHLQSKLILINKNIDSISSTFIRELISNKKYKQLRELGYTDLYDTFLNN